MFARQIRFKREMNVLYELSTLKKSFSAFIQRRQICTSSYAGKAASLEDVVDAA